MATGQEGGGGLLDGGAGLRFDPRMASWASWLPVKSLRWLRHVFRGRAVGGGGGDSAVGPACLSDTTVDQPRKLRSTAWLDGLRGFAAFLVYFHHHQLWVHQAPTNLGTAVLENGFGWGGSHRFATMYGIRTFFTGGHLAVAVFYVISGYVLSLKALRLIQAGEVLKTADALGSALFRRWFRLFIPLIVTTFVFITLWHVFGMWLPHVDVKSTYGEEVWEWYATFKNFSFLFKEGHMWPPCNMHLWTIPLEMRGSMVVYVALLTLSRATTQARLLGQVVLIFYFFYVVDGWYCGVFMSGMLQCDLYLLERRPEGRMPHFLRSLAPYRTTMAYVFLAVATWLAGVPAHTTKIEDLRKNPGWYYMASLKPQAVYDYKWFFLSVAANLLVAAIPHLPCMRRFFETPFCQYLGRISFALYLVHGPVLLTIGDRVYHAVGWVRPNEEHKRMLAAYINLFPLPRWGPLGLEPAFWIPQLVLLPLTLWLADITTRLVDEPAVQISQRLYKWTLGGSAPDPRPDVNLMRLV